MTTSVNRYIKRYYYFSAVSLQSPATATNGTKYSAESNQKVALLLDVSKADNQEKALSQNHGHEDAKLLGTAYNNLSASAHGIETYDVVVRGSGHLNFSDLPLFSPALAYMLGTGKVDTRYCIETMNQIVLDFFDHTPKDAKEKSLQGRS